VPVLCFLGVSLTGKTELTSFSSRMHGQGDLRKLGVENCTLVGLSYGRIVGFKMAEMFPDLVVSFVTIFFRFKPKMENEKFLSTPRMFL
jgi:hypothetical protein